MLSLLAVLAFVGLVPLGSIAWKLIDSNREALKTTQQQYQLLLASSIASELRVQVGTARDQVVSLSRSVGATWRSRGRLRADDLEKSWQESPDSDIVYARLITARGEALSSDPDTKIPAVLDATFQRAVVEVTKQREQDAEPRADVWLSDPILLPGRNHSEPYIVAAIPVEVRGAVRGVLAGVIDFQSIWDRVVQRARSGQTVFAMDSSGLMFASSDPLNLSPGMDLQGSAIVDRFLHTKSTGAQTAPFVWVVDGREERYIGSFEVTPERWGIIVQAPEQQVYLAVRSMMEETLSWALAAFSLSILAAVFFARTLSTPIGRLASAARAFATGDFSVRAQVTSGNEIGELADTFNGMADDIERHIRRLKQAAAENNQLFLGTIRALANAIDAKDPYTRGHSVRVNRYSVIIANYMGLSREEIHDIHVSSVLHDVGKIGIDDSILKKPGALTREEFEVMKTHAPRGAEIMAPIRQMKRILPGLRYHHERWNGSGYPEGLAGKDIPMMGRIIAVADTFDAMTTHRPYQRAFSFDAAVAKINDLKGVGFDEQVVEAFNRAYQAGEFGTEPQQEETVESAIA